MISFSKEDGEKNYPGDPPEGDINWLWYRPGTGMYDSLFPNYTSFCGRCDVFDVQNRENKHFRCWHCGRFLPRPKSWNEGAFRPGPSRYSFTQPTLTEDE